MIVSVERIVDEVTDALLFAHEVDAIVEAPGGARPTALPGAYAADLARVGAYVRGEGALTMSTPREVADALTWSLARQCRDDDVLVVGVATPLAAAAGMLARELLAPGLTIIMAASVNPKTHDVAESLTDPAAAARRAPGTLTQAEILDAIQRGRVTLQFVSPAEVDAEGRINTNRVGGRRLPGALALPDVAVLVGRLVAYRAGHSPRFLVPRVQYVTGRAGGVRAIVTDKAEIALGGRRA